MMAGLRRRIASTKIAAFVRRLVTAEELATPNPRCNPVFSGAYEDKPGFLEAYKTGLKTIEPLGDAGNVYRYDMQRVYVCCWAAKHGLSLAGDFVECGVNAGFLSRAVMQYIEFEKHPSRNFYLLDTFTGLDISQLSPGERAMGLEEYNKYHYGRDVYEQVQKTFQDYPNAAIIKGSVPGTLQQCTAESVCYLSIDMNCAYPEFEALAFFYGKLSPSAWVILDDYGFGKFVHQRKALDAFAKDVGIDILELPTGQGIIVKAPSVSESRQRSAES